MKLHALIFVSALIAAGSTAQAMDMNKKTLQEALLRKQLDERNAELKRKETCADIINCCRWCCNWECCKWVGCYCGTVQ